MIEVKILPQYEKKLDALLSNSKVQKALDICKSEVDKAMDEQIELCEIEAPSFKEQNRAKRFSEKLKELGIDNVKIDEAGNVIATRPGIDPNGPVIALGAHMDSVFPSGTNVKVRKEGNTYYAPGIGDNCSGLRALLQIARALQIADIKTEGTIVFVGTVGEEGNGDLKGSKYFCAHNKVDGFIAVDSTDVGRILKGAVGSHRWRVTIEGPGGHSYADFGKVPNAIHAICRAGSLISDIHTPADPKTTFSIGIIKGGTSVNSIPAQAQVEIDMRSVSNDELLKLEQSVLFAFEEAVRLENARWNIAGEHNGLKLSKEMIGNRPAGVRPDDCPVLQCAFASQKHLGIKLTNHGMTSTDANVPMSMNIPSTCLSSGGKGIGAHTLTEHFVMENTHLGPQLVMLTALALVGTEHIQGTLPKL